MEERTYGNFEEVTIVISRSSCMRTLFYTWQLTVREITLHHIISPPGILNMQNASDNSLLMITISNYYNKTRGYRA